MLDVEDDIELLQRTGNFASEEEFLREAFEALLEKRPELRQELAVEKYRNGDISLNRGAELAGVAPERFKELLAEGGVSRDAGFLSEEDRDRELNDL